MPSLAFIRPVRLSDLDALFALAKTTGFGLTTLPPDRSLLERRIQASLQGFEQRLREPSGQAYLLVLERDGTLLGSSGMASKTGGFEPFYAYRLETEHFASKTLGISRDVPVLKLVMEHSGPGEIGSLLLAREGRGQGLGSLLSRSRFLFMAEHPDLFEETIIAELRGIVDDQGHAPFWEAIGAHFFGMDYAKADYLVVKSKKFIADLMPRHPIYVPLLPRAAQEVIGQVHPETRPALRLLEQEGFQPTGWVDIFEAGPALSCPRPEIRTVRESRRARLAIGPVPDASPDCLLANTSMNFRACQAPAQLLAPDQIRLSAEVAAILEVAEGDLVRILPLETRTSRTITDQAPL